MGLPFLKQFLNILPSYKNYDEKSPAEFQITDLFSVPGVGTVGFFISIANAFSFWNSVEWIGAYGRVDAAWTGLSWPFFPMRYQEYPAEACCRSLGINFRHQLMFVTMKARAGQSVSFALKKVRRAHLRKGMVMLSRNVNPLSYWEFEAEILVLYHSSVICSYCCFYCPFIRRSLRTIRRCSIVEMCVRPPALSPSSTSMQNQRILQSLIMSTMHHPQLHL